MAELIILANGNGSGSGIVGGGNWGDVHGTVNANSTFSDTRARDKNQSGYEIIRGWSFFDTSSIGSGTVLTSAVMRFRRNGGAVRGNSTCYWTTFSPSTFEPNNRRGDYYNRNNYGGAVGSFDYAGLTNDAWNDRTFPTSAINKTGWTLIGWRAYYDYANSPAPSGENDFSFGNTSSGEIVRLVIQTSEIPQVTTSAATNVGIYGATGNGNVTSDGGQGITQRGIVINKTGNPTISDTKFVVAGTTGVFSVALTSLASSTLYYARAFATNPVGTGYGTQVTFETKAGGALFATMI